MDALELAELVFPKQLLVLPSARRSAAASPYRNPHRLFHVLALLALFGPNDGVLTEALRNSLGRKARWRPKDGDATMGQHGARRRWKDSSGEPRVFEKHVTLGRSLDTRKCLQVYYWVSPKSIIEIAWVGVHRPTVSVDS